MKLRNPLQYVRKTGVKTAAIQLLLGTRERRGLLTNLLLYSLLIVFSYVFLYPILYMFVTSIKSLSDLINDSVVWIPSRIDFSSYAQALKVMDFTGSLVDTLKLTLLPAICQVITAAFTGYAFAQYRFRFRKPLLGLLLLTFIVPRIVTLMPTYLLYKQMKLLGTLGAILYPAILGQGLNAAIIVLIFYQFYRQLPVSIVEAAKLDGCGHWRVFTRIALPTVRAAALIAFLFSFVWYWNETTLVGTFVSNTAHGSGSSMSTLLVNLQNFEANYKTLFGAENATKMNEAVVMAGSVLCVGPLLIVYFALQKYFVQSVDMVGIKD